MNQRPQGFLLAKAIEGFLQFKTAEALSPRTIESYKKHLEQWLDYAGDVKVSRITTADVHGYLAHTAKTFRRYTDLIKPNEQHLIQKVLLSNPTR